MTRTAIVGGSVVSPQGSVAADVLIEDGVILQVGEVDRAGSEVLDAAGCFVLPGAIDVHTHVLGRMRDDTRSALCGGTTASLVFVDAEDGERPAEAAQRALADELPDSLIDLAFHTVIWEPRAYRKGDLRETAELGIGSVKLWLAYVEYGIQAEDDVAFRVMQEAAELGMVVLAHCENGRVIDVLTRQLIERGELGTASLPKSRPISLEAECVHRFLVLAELAGATPYVVHVSGRQSLDEIVAARARGMTAYGEVCPHHLLFDVSDHSGPDAVRYVMTPPLRTAEDRQALARALRDGGLDTLASDHCHISLEDKLPTIGDFSKIPTGLPGIAARLPIGFTLAPDGAPIPIERLVEVACAAPARIFELPGKGVIAPGADADIVVWDPSRPSTITVESVDDGLEWTPFGGIPVPGSFRYVLARGDRMVEEGRFTGAEHAGAYLPIARAAARAHSGSQA
jgi:dihydropyrimidinase